MNKYSWFWLSKYRIMMILVTSLVFFLGVFVGTVCNLGTYFSFVHINVNKNTSSVDKVSIVPSVSFPLSYFAKDKFRGGNAGASSTLDDEYTWNLAYVDVDQQSFPTTTIRLSPKDYSVESQDMPPIKSREQLLSFSDIFRDSFTEQISKYRNLAQRFLPEHSIMNVKKIDIDGDGITESIIELCSGGNNCPNSLLVIKNDKIIFSTEGALLNPSIIAADTPNGFYLTWTPFTTDQEVWDEGLCCMLGHIKTRFIFNTGKLEPVYEEKVLYLKVKNLK